MHKQLLHDWPSPTANYSSCRKMLGVVICSKVPNFTSSSSSQSYNNLLSPFIIARSIAVARYLIFDSMIRACRCNKYCSTPASRRWLVASRR